MKIFKLISLVMIFPIILIGLYYSSRYNYLLFHLITELFSVLIAGAIFVIAWNTRRIYQNSFFLFIGVCFIFIAGMDFIHALAYKGMDIFLGYDANLATQFWILARYIQSFSFFLSPLIINKKLNIRLLFIGYFSCSIFFVWSIFAGIFPACFIEGVGLTPFKIISEYIIVFIFLGTILVFYQKRKEFDSYILKLIILVIIISITEELAFTLYTDVYGLLNLIGHILKILAFYCIYKAFIETTLLKPYNLIFQNAHLELARKVELRTKELQASEQKFRNIILNLDEAFYNTSMVGILLDHNPAFNKILGFDEKENLIGTKLPDFWQNPEDRTAYLQQLLKNGFIRNYIINAKKKNGEKIIVQANSHLVRDDKGAPLRIEGTFLDVTKPKEAAEEIEKMGAYNRSLIEASLDPLVTIGENGKITDVNHATEIITGRNRDSLIATDFSDYFTDPERARSGYRMAFAMGSVRDFELKVRHIDGHLTPVMYTASVFKDNNGNVKGVFAAARDITERKQAEEELYNLNRLLRTVRNINQLITREKNKEKLIQGACNYLNEAIDSGTTWIALLDDNLKLTATVQAGSAIDFQPILAKIESGKLPHCIHMALNSPDVGIIKDTAITCDCPNAIRYPERGVMVSRLEYVGRLFGILTVSMPLKFIMESEEQSLFKEVCGDIAFGLYNIELEDKRVKAEESVEQEKEKYRVLVDTMNEGFVVQDENGIVTYVNDRLYQILGYTRNEILGKPWTFYLDPKSLKIVSEEMAKREKGRESIYEVTWIKKNGQHVITLIAGKPILDIKGNFRGSFKVITDITGLKKIEHELDIRNQIAEVFLTISDEDMYGEVLKILLKAFESEYGVFGYIDEKGALVVPSMKRHLLDICQVQEKRLTFPRETWGDSIWPQAIRQKRLLCSNERSTKTPKGHILIERNISVPVINRGEVIGLIQVANKKMDYNDEDFRLMQIITDYLAPVLNARLQRDKHEKARNNAEEALKETVNNLERSNSELQQFAYVASHDLQEPLRMVASYMQLLERRYKDKLDNDAQEFIAYAVNGATRMKALINDLLQYSRIETRANPFELTDMENVLNQTISNLEMTIKENNAIITHNALPPIKADSMQMVQLLQNLIDNGIKFHSDKPPQIYIGAQQNENEWVFSVRDNGIGIDPQYFNRLFIIFQRLHSRDEYPGTGIGLAVCKRIVARHGGKIWVESKAGEGATFYFTIPIRRGESNKEK